MLVSVVIRAKNEARFIGETLQAVYAQEGLPSFEVVVVDSGSTDGTPDIARRWPVRLLRIPPHSFSYGRALNLGIQAARGIFVASLSAHSLPAHPRWLASLLAPFRQPAVAAVYGRQLPRSNATLLELAGMWLSGVTGTRPRVSATNPMLSNANSAFRRALCLAYPFDEQVGGGEDLAWARLCQRLGYLVAYEPTAAVYHSHGEPLHRHLRRTWRDLPTVSRALLGWASRPLGRTGGLGVTPP